jgi:hypothetical protein
MDARRYADFRAAVVRRRAQLCAAEPLRAAFGRLLRAYARDLDACHRVRGALNPFLFADALAAPPDAHAVLLALAALPPRGAAVLFAALASAPVLIGLLLTDYAWGEKSCRTSAIR